MTSFYIILATYAVLQICGWVLLMQALKMNFNRLNMIYAKISRIKQLVVHANQGD